MQKHVLRILGLALMVALGLTAFAASSASAANLKPSEWVKGSITVLKQVNLKAKVTGTLKLGTLLVPTLGIEIHCEKGTVVEAEIINPGAGEALGKFLFENCKLYPINASGELTSSEPLPCIISNGGVNHHITATAFILVITHEKTLYLVAEPDPEGKPFTTIEYEKEKGCPIPLKQEVKGNYTFEVNPQTGEPTSFTIIAGLKPLQELLGTKLLYGINEAIIHGEGTALLTGAHLGCTWAII